MMNYGKIIRAVFAAMLFSAPAGFASAQEIAINTRMDLSGVYDAAKANDPVFASAKSAMEAGTEKAWQAYSLLLPTIGATATAQRNDVSTTYKDAPDNFILKSRNQNYDTSSMNVSLSQPIFRLGTFASFSQLRMGAEQSELAFASAKQELVLRSAQTYFDVLLGLDTLEFIRAQKKAISEQLKQAKKMFEVGAATITDTHDAQARFDIASAQEISAANDLQIKKESLARLIGAPPPDITPLMEEFKFDPPAPDSAEKWIEKADKENFGLKSARLGLEIAQKEKTKSWAGHLPSLDLIAGYTYNTQSDSSFGAGSDTRATAVGAQLTMPIFAGGGTHSKVREATALAEKARMDVEDSSRQTRLAAYSAFASVVNGAAQVEALKQAAASSRKSLDSTRKGFEVGVRTAVDVLNAQQLLFSSLRDYAQAKYGYILNTLRLKAIAGELSESDIASVNALLDIEE